MKTRITFILAAILLLGIESNAQETIYIKYTNECMTLLEYKEDKNPESPMYHYMVSNNNQSKLVFNVNREKNVIMRELPSSVKSCNQLGFNSELARKVNLGLLDLFVLYPNKDYGFDIHEIEVVDELHYVDGVMRYSTLDYSFNYDVNRIYGVDNLAENTEDTEIYYKGDTGLDCKSVYSFRKNNRTTCGNFTDLAIIPEIGVVKYEEKSKVEGTIVNLRTFTLQYINNLPVDNYVGGSCQGNRLQDPILYVNKPTINTIPEPVAAAPVPQAVPQISASTPSVSIPSAVPSVQMEEAVPQSYEIQTELVLEECDNPKKAGYHIVQPNETLGEISKATGIPTAALAKWNDIANQNQIEVCSELRLSPPSEITPVDYDDVLVARGGDVVVKEEPKNLNLAPCGLENHEGIHIVKKGETLYSIAKKYGYTAEKFMEINDLESDVISPCMNLKTTNCACPADSVHDHDLVEKGVEEVPSEYGEPVLVKKERKFHELSTGDTLYGLSKKYDISVEKLLAMNEIEDATNLSIGDKIYLEE